MIFLGVGPIALEISATIGQRSPNCRQYFYSHRMTNSTLRSIENVKFTQNIDDICRLDFKLATLFIVSWRTFDRFENSKFDELARKINLSGNCRVINLSSASVYGSNQNRVNERSELVPLNEYGQEKVKIERYLENSFINKISNLRISNVLCLNMSKSFPIVLLGNLLQGKLTIVPDPNRYSRDYIQIELVAISIIDIGIKMLSDRVPTNLNVSSGKSCTLEKFIAIAEEALDLKLNQKYRDFEVGEI